jgi:hypothetical protein
LLGFSEEHYIVVGATYSNPRSTGVLDSLIMFAVAE